MHNLAIALHRKGYEVTGSDDEIFEPSRTRLKNEGILPDELGWHPEKLDESYESFMNRFCEAYNAVIRLKDNKCV